MKIEHFAYNVSDPVAIADWYCKYLGFSVARKMDGAPHTHFLKDSSGAVMIEIYCNPPSEVPDYPSMNPLQLHLAFVSENPNEDAERLVAAGAKVVDDLHLKDGSHLMMLKDPWGFAVQLCKRGTPML
ncbi:VOC family protein [Saccharophagus degradans]|uniref:VOC family protein n=1 Tax=Saccharophagus degradans TaxID=86304 RepID=UPI001C09F491|nr:VOC family protein [Saccharophagus degradans]MBU2987538.1 VOC family protein [Saccharophagus degradans]WGO97628.1 VOC family protein [Saccharophagus degradans]